MMPISQSQLQALTAALHQARKDWDLPGIRRALARAADLGSFADLGVAAFRCAANPDMKTPALIPEPGVHWQGTTIGSRPAPTMCPDHPEQKAGHCVQCIKAAEGVLKPADFPMPRKRPGYVPKPKMLTADPGELEQTRKRADFLETL